MNCLCLITIVHTYCSTFYISSMEIKKELLIHEIIMHYFTLNFNYHNVFMPKLFMSINQFRF